MEVKPDSGTIHPLLAIFYLPPPYTIETHLKTNHRLLHGVLCSSEKNLQHTDA